ncbi:sm-like protein LSM7 [Raphanus sativus]|uniref:Sm-like protein LSM7 n=1 Tax=Raphanus sativus TaxID=3726 RepID=A0A9W3BY54_RAPSA|nr:sm-like protein LSM7 [Raphanus sativus]
MSGRKETVLDLAKFVDKGVQVKLTGGRQDHDDPLKTTDQKRLLGLVVCSGTAVMLVSPTDGTEEIANPFGQPEAV